MTSSWKAYVAALIVLLIADAIWLNVSKGMYNILVKRVQGKDIRVRFLPALLCYVVLYIGIIVFAIPLAMQYAKRIGKVLAAWFVGGLFGLVAYGVFNLTNLAIFSDYLWSTALIDTCWGVFVCSLTTYAGLYFAA
jgi:uncharacterized membrane protein